MSRGVMEPVSPLQLVTAIRECGLYKPEQCSAADRVASAAADAASCAEEFYQIGVLTKYQYQKTRAGRADDLLFGPYLILERIGEGGMGKVYRAVERNVGRVVAIKMVRPQLLTNRMVISRYKREAKAAAKLDHPNIVSLFDADDFNGRYFLAMEYVDGIDLSKMVKQFGNPPNIGLSDYHEAAEYIRQASLGLQHAHEHGLVHRDVKPSNLLVFGERPLVGTAGKATVKILDMGLVRSILESEDVSRTELTRDGTVVGTPDYMAPEQAKNSSTVDHRADLYSLGCSLYFLLRGQAVFPEGSPIDKLIRHQLDPAPDIRKVRPDLPDGLAAVIDKLLKKRPEDRYQTASEVALALAPFTASAAAGAGQNQVQGSVEETILYAPQPFSLEPEANAGPNSFTPAPIPAVSARRQSGGEAAEVATGPAVRVRSQSSTDTPPHSATPAATNRPAGPPPSVRVRPAAPRSPSTPVVDAEVVTPRPARSESYPPPPPPAPPSRSRKPTAFRERKVGSRSRPQKNYKLLIASIVLAVALVILGIALAIRLTT